MRMKAKDSHVLKNKFNIYSQPEGLYDIQYKYIQIGRES